MKCSKMDGPNLRKIHDRKLSKLGRRNFVKSLITAGVGVTTAAHISVDDVRGAASDQIPIVVGFESVPDDPTAKKPVKKYVPLDWYEDYQTALQVHERRSSALASRPGVKAIWVEPGKRGGRNARLQIDIHERHYPETRGTIPEAIDGVPVEVGQVSGHELGCNTLNYYTGHYPDDAPGSIQVCNGSSSATLTSRVWNANLGKYQFLIANHLFGGNHDDYRGDPVYQPDTSNQQLGEVWYGRCYLDAMVVDPVNSHQPVDRINDATPVEDLQGHFTKDGCADLASQNEDVRKNGCRTGSTSGVVEGVGKTYYYGCWEKVGQLKWGDSSKFDDGDSGSLAYHRAPQMFGDGYRDDYIFGVGMCNARTADYGSIVGEDYIWGTACYKLDSAAGWEVK